MDPPRTLVFEVKATVAYVLSLGERPPIERSDLVFVKNGVIGRIMS